jgi:general secretion pathway protein D
MDLVSMFDVDWLAGMSFGLFPLESADAAALVLELDQVFGGLEAGPLAGVVRFLPIERLNAVLAMTAQPAYLDRAQVWIERLDRAAEGDQERVFVYAVQNGRAADLAGVLGELFDAESTTVSPSGLLAPGMEAAQIRSSGFDVGAQDGETDDPESRSRERPIRRAASASRGSGGAFGGGSSPLSTPQSREPGIRIIADETTNSLVVRATAKDYRRIAAALEDLDVVPLQVLIEATIAEVLLNDSLKYGVEWFFRFGDVRINLSSQDSGTVAPSFPGFSAFFANSDVRAVINALEEVTDINVISSPHILVLDNQTARLQVGDEVPIATQSSTSVTDPDAPVVNTIEQRDTGVILSVTPRVNASGLVIMEIEEETSDAQQTTTSSIDSPTIRQRRISSTIAIQSGETVVLGGLIRDDLQKGRSGVPFLSGLPLIGPLFGTYDNSATRNELLVLITPRVIRGTNDAREVTAELRRRLSGLFPLHEKIR